MLQSALVFDVPPHLRPLTDNCGTGGDQSGSFNISTTSAVVAASAGVKLAKHGNRGVSSRCGSADLFFALGFPDDLPPAEAMQLLLRWGFTFFFAPHFHPSLRYVMPVRKSLGVRTIFNLLGPLANPLAPEYKLVGVGERSCLRPMAEALQQLGVKRAAVVHSDDGMDELSPCAPSQMLVLAGGRLQTQSVDPKKLGVFVASRTELQGGDAQENAAIFHRLLAGDTASGAAQAVILNAGAVLWLAEAVPSLEAGIDQARQQLAQGKAQAFFQGWLAEALALRTAAARSHP